MPAWFEQDYTRAEARAEDPDQGLRSHIQKTSAALRRLLAAEAVVAPTR